MSFYWILGDDKENIEHGIEDLESKVFGYECISEKEDIADKPVERLTMKELKDLYKENRPRSKRAVRDALFYNKGQTEDKRYLIGIRYY